MKRNFEKFSKKKYDLLVIGGGINGAGIAHLAQDHGLEVALLEKGDFASGTSGNSTKLIHGGIRYLEHFNFDLVRESLEERAIQLKAAAHLVEPLSFVIPVYKGDRRPLWMIRLGVFLYDCFAGRYAIGKHRGLTPDEILELIPGIKRQGLRGGALYYDAQMDDARLCLENILSAREKGADIANYAEVISFLKEKRKVVGVVAKDTLGDAVFEIRARNVVCAVGPWSNQILKKDSPSARGIIRATKGVHIVYDEKFSDHAVLLPSDRDNRIFFVIPWMGHSLIGTTDTDYTEAADAVEVLDEDIQYLVENTKRVFPNRDFSAKKIITSFAGLRPLVKKPGDPSKVTRSHAIVKTKSGLVFVTGGKYTTYRKIAEHTLQEMFNIKITKPFHLYGGGEINLKADEVAGQYNIDPNTLTFLMGKYGTRYQELLGLLIKEKTPPLKELGGSISPSLRLGEPGPVDKLLARKICDCSPTIEAQLVYSVQNEMALTADDLISRRLCLQFYPCQSQNCRNLITRFMQEPERFLRK